MNALETGLQRDSKKMIAPMKNAAVSNRQAIKHFYSSRSWDQGIPAMYDTRLPDYDRAMQAVRVAPLACSKDILEIE